MDLHQIISWIGKLVPVAIVAGLLADWFRLRLARRAEERKYIARTISELLELRHIIRALPELPKHFDQMIPQQLKPHFPANAWQMFDVMQFLPMDEKLPERYKKAVEEIAGFDPVLAFQLRGKERYFDLRGFISKHFSQTPGSPIIANKITETLDKDCLPVIEDALRSLAKAHSIKMQISINYALRCKTIDEDFIPSETKRVFQEQVLELVKSIEPRLLTGANSSQKLV